MPNVNLYKQSSLCFGFSYPNMFYGARALAKMNPALAKTEKDFLAGKRYPEIKVTITLANGSVINEPMKPPPAKVL